MNREIKFRAWDKENKKFFEPATRLNAMTISITLNGEIIGHPNIGEITSLYVLNQYTGIDDVTGKQIYEGDIIKDVSAKPSFEGIRSVDYYYGSFGVKDYHLWQLPKIEVVGNIFENPELLK